MKPKRNQPCPCGSGKKFKKCCTTEILECRELIRWLQANDHEPPIDYCEITKEEMTDPDTIGVLRGRVKEIYHTIELKKAEDLLNKSDQFMKLKAEHERTYI